MMSKKQEVVLGTIHCGQEVTPGRLAEKPESGRHPSLRAAGPGWAVRIGEDCGSTSRFQASAEKVMTVDIKGSLKAAALALADNAKVMLTQSAVPCITARGSQ